MSLRVTCFVRWDKLTTKKYVCVCVQTRRKCPQCTQLSLDTLRNCVFLGHWTLENYSVVQERSDYMKFLWNSVIIAGGSTLIGVIVAMVAIVSGSSGGNGGDANNNMTPEDMMNNMTDTNDTLYALLEPSMPPTFAGWEA